MKLPRDLSGEELAQRLTRLGYRISPQTGGHLRLETDQGGTLRSILKDLEAHHGLTRNQLLKLLFD
jgi:hypothetical protein